MAFIDKINRNFSNVRTRRLLHLQPEIPKWKCLSILIQRNKKLDQMRLWALNLVAFRLLRGRAIFIINYHGNQICMTGYERKSALIALLLEICFRHNHADAIQQQIP